LGTPSKEGEFFAFGLSHQRNRLKRLTLRQNTADFAGVGVALRF
jgi:hypothetical protein